MFARSTRRVVAILGLLALFAPQESREVIAAQPQCNARQQVTFLTPGDAASQSGVVTVACATSKVRGLMPHTPIRVRLLDPTALRNQITQITQAEVAAEQLAGVTATLQLLGALGPKQDLGAVDRSQYNVNSAADYDIRTKTLYVRGSKTSFTPLDRATIAHEYTRALQDQYFGLAGLLSNGSDPISHNSDALLARQAVVEGDAFTTMLNFTLTFSRQDQVLFNQQLQRSSPTASDFAHDRIGFPASQGTNFVKYIMAAAAKGKKGNAATAAGVTAVNHALANPPSTTSEVVNPAVYLQHSQNNATQAVPEVQIGQNWQEIDSDVLGSFGINELLSQHNAPAAVVHAASDAANSWQGDRWVVYQHGNSLMLIWRIHFGTAGGAQAFQRALLAYTGTRFHTTLSALAPVDWRTTAYAISVRSRGADVAVAIGSSGDLLATCTRSVGLLGF
jgi:hypothetical protein